MWLAQILLSALQIILIVGLAYYYFLLVAALFRVPKQRSNSNELSPIVFAVAIPCHNEEVVIGKTVHGLRRMNYPADLYDVYVAADYCSDKTAVIARQAGAICLERNEGPRGRKAFPLQWLLQHIIQSERQYNAVVIFDADSRVDTEFLSAMAAALQQGHVALQGQHIIANPSDSKFSRLAAIDMCLNNLLRNQAKNNLGWSCRLMGDAMCLTTNLIRVYGWGSDSLAEDREFEMYLLLQGQKVRYVENAVSYGEAVTKWNEASKQRVRWYGGATQLRYKYAWPLLINGLNTVNLAALDRALELFLPSFSLLAALTLGMWVVQVLWPSLPLLLPVEATTLGIALWVLFPFCGLVIDRAPIWMFKTMLYAPFYAVWRIVQGSRATIKRGQVEWVRTRRREEQSERD
jgi:cellulose synthase/poly-beta-1,6-N-acetylglucosamine synthase-like glycosyltransferase